jgi:hypothetical protein
VKGILGILLMLGALGIGVLAMLTSFPMVSNLEIQRILIFGGIMFLSGCGAFSLAMMGLMLLWEDRKDDLEKEIKSLALRTPESARSGPVAPD